MRTPAESSRESRFGGFLWVFFTGCLLVSSISARTANARVDTSRVRQLEIRADSLYGQFSEVKALEIYNRILELDSLHFRALWRSSFLYSRIGYRQEEKDQKIEYYNRALERAELALQVDDNHSQSNFVMAVALGRKALVSKARKRVAASREIKRYGERAIRLDSTNAGAWHVLGRWHHEVSNLGFFERLAANTLYGGIPKGASEEKAADYIEKAIELKPDIILYYYDLARVYKDMGKKDRAVQLCREGIRREPKTPDDPVIIHDCKALMNELK